MPTATRCSATTSAFFKSPESSRATIISSVEKSGYFPAEPEPDHQDRPKHHLGSGDPARLRFELNPPATLSGRVVGPDGNPARAAVSLGLGQIVNTSADGSFAFEKLRSGSYTVLALPKTTGPVSGKDELRREVVPTYYPSVVERIQAGSIMVRAGAELTGYEIRLQSAEVYRVRGVVLDSEGKPAAKAMAQLHARIAGGTPDAFFFAGGQGTFSIQNGPFASEPSELEPVVTGEDGVFEFPAVRAGEWSVQAESKPAGDEVRHRDIFSFGSATFSLGHADRDGITIQLAKPIDLSGDIVVGDGSPLPAGVLVAVSLYSENGRSSAAANTKGDGVLQFESVIPGAHEIRADVMAGNYHIQSVLMGSNNITGQSVGISPGDYYAIALDHFDSRTMAEGVRLRSLMPMATSVRVEQGSAGSVQLRVHHAPD